MKKIKVRAQVKSFAFWNTAKKKNYSIFRAPPGRIHSFSQPLSSADGRRSSSLRRFQNTSWFSATSDSCWIHTKTVKTQIGELIMRHDACHLVLCQPLGRFFLLVANRTRQFPSGYSTMQAIHVSRRELLAKIPSLSLVLEIGRF